MGKFDGYLLVSDFDNTLRICGQATVPKANLAAAEYFMAEGGLFTIATGRDPFSFLSIKPLFRVNAPAVLSNGAIIFDPESGEDLYESFLSFSCREDMKALLAAFPEVGMEIVRGTDVRVVRSNANLERHIALMNGTVVLADIDKIMYPWTKVCVLLMKDRKEDPSACQAIEDWIEEHCCGKYDVVGTDYVLDIAAAGNNKGSGVQRLASFLDIPKEKLICVGDSWNDLPMLRIAGKAFAPANAEEDVKKEPGVTVVSECETCLADIIAALWY